MFKALNEAVPNNLKDWNRTRLKVEEFAKEWTEIKGYPIVIVRRLDEKRVELTQKPFRFDFQSNSMDM